MCNFDLEIWIFWAKIQLFVLELQFLSTVQITTIHDFPIRTTPRKNSVSELWVILWGSPRFLAISGFCHFAIISTLNFGPWSTKLSGIVRAIKKMTHNDSRPHPGQNYRETAVVTFGQKVFFLSKSLPPLHCEGTVCQ